jgi:hypothetical protein
MTQPWSSLVLLGILALPPANMLMVLFGMPVWNAICRQTGRDPDKTSIVTVWFLGVVTVHVVCLALYMLGVRLPPISVDY